MIFNILAILHNLPMAPNISRHVDLRLLTLRVPLLMVASLALGISISTLLRFLCKSFGIPFKSFVSAVYVLLVAVLVPALSFISSHTYGTSSSDLYSAYITPGFYVLTLTLLVWGMMYAAHRAEVRLVGAPLRHHSRRALAIATLRPSSCVVTAHRRQPHKHHAAAHAARMAAIIRDFEGRLKATEDGSRDLARRLEEAVRLNANLSATADNLRSDATGMADKIKALNAALALARLSGTEMDGELEAKRGTMEERDRTIASLNDTIAELRQVLALIEASGEKTAALLVREKEALVSCKAALDAARSSEHEHKKIVEEASAAKTALEANLATARYKAEDDAAHIIDLNNQLNLACEDLYEKNTELSAKDALITSRDVHVLELKAAQDALQFSVDAKETMLAKKEDTIRDLEGALEAHRLNENTQARAIAEEALGRELLEKNNIITSKDKTIHDLQATINSLPSTGKATNKAEQEALEREVLDSKLEVHRLKFAHRKELDEAERVSDEYKVAVKRLEATVSRQTGELTQKARMIEAREDQIAELLPHGKENERLKTVVAQYEDLLQHAAKNFLMCKEDNSELAAQNKEYTQKSKRQAQELEQRDARIRELEARLHAQSATGAVENSEVARVLKQNNWLRNTVDQYEEVVEHAARNFRMCKDDNAELTARNEMQAKELESCVSRIRELEVARRARSSPVHATTATPPADQPSTSVSGVPSVPQLRDLPRTTGLGTTSVTPAPVSRVSGIVKTSPSVRVRPSAIPSPGAPKPTSRIAQGKENAVPKTAVARSATAAVKTTSSRIARPTTSRRPLSSSLAVNRV